jgi:hypothetical protein
LSDARLRLILDYAFGIALNVGILLLARGVGLNQVEEKSSYGLGPIISMLGAVDVLWAQGMWSGRPRGQSLELEKKP